MTSYKEKLHSIRTLIFDVDGVFTNGDIFVTETDYIRKFNAKDGYAVQLASKSGFEIFIITGGRSETMKEALLRLGCTDVILGAKNKLLAFQELKDKYQLDEHSCLYVGDDMPDISLLKTVFLSACPQDAAVDVKAICDYQSPYNGGHGCVRDIIEQTLRVQNKWDKNGNHEW
jgi:3-deoxy-D-manno-octulosonate 8-phosphate phosphatase (KDO 8-P phosphatase)